MDKQAKCPICHGTGFSKPGEICPCITGIKKMKAAGIGDSDMPDFLKDLFGGFSANAEKDENSER